MDKHYSFEELVTAVEARFTEVGVDPACARKLGEYFATVEFYGVKSHGVKTLGAHLDRIRRGGYNLTPSFPVRREGPAFAVIDGEGSIGMLCADHCIEYAMSRAEESGVFTVFSHNNNTYGAAFYYALKAAKRGFVCVTSSNSPAQMAPPGGIDKVLGTNPFAIAIPAKKEHPIVVDMATSAVAKSKLNEYKQKGQPIPSGWALDSRGRPTQDAQAAIDGLMLPMAGFKGYGISMMIDIISGVMSGAAALGSVGRFYTPEGAPMTAMNVGFSFTLMSCEQIYGGEFYTEMDNYISRVRGGRTAEGGTIALPGDDRIANWCESMKNGCGVSVQI